MATESQGSARPDGDVELPFDASIGFTIRTTHRLIQRSLLSRIQRHGISLGMWYFLRALWDEEGLTQRDLSAIVGTMEPTTLTAIKSMERAGLVKRVPNAADRRKLNIYLTKRGKALKKELLPLALEVTQIASAGLSEEDKDMLFGFLRRIQKNLHDDAPNDLDV
jgi:DNA-binding MarR family transcriptional regulator